MKFSTLLGFFAYIGGVEFFFRRIWLNFMAFTYPQEMVKTYKWVHGVLEGLPYWGPNIDALARTNYSDADLVHYAAYGIVGLALVAARRCGLETPARWVLTLLFCTGLGLVLYGSWPWIRPLLPRLV